MVDAKLQDDPAQFAQEGLRAVLFGEPRDQMVFSLLGMAIAYVSALFSFGATLILVVLFTITFLIGLGRFGLQMLRG